MKIALIINPTKHIQTNIILKNTVYENSVSLVHNESFHMSKEFFSFVEELIGNGKLGEINECFVSVIDIEKLDSCINPLDKILNLIEISEL